MKLRLASCFLLVALLHLCIDARRSSSGGNRRGGSSSSGGSIFSRGGTSKPSHSNYGSNPGTIGWNVPPKRPSSTITKPSAPSSEHVSKTSATNVKSGYQPSGGYGHQTGGSFGQSGSHNQAPPAYSQNYNPPVNSGYQSPGGYNTYNSQGYHPPAGGYHPPAGGSYSPVNSPGQAYQPYNGHNPSLGHSYQPGAGYNPPVAQAPQTVYIQSVGQPSSSRGIGQIAKEAVVFAGVNAAVNAAANRIIPGGIYGTSHGSSSSNVNSAPPSVSHTEITYNYYNNGTTVGNSPAASLNVPDQNPQNSHIPVQSLPNSNVNANNLANSSTPTLPAVAASSLDQQQNSDAPSPNNADANFPSPSGTIVTKAEIEKFTEDLLTKDTNNAGKWITMKLQGQKMDDSVQDDAPELLLTVQEEAWSISTIKAVLELHDNYELDVRTKEAVTNEERREENAFLDLILETEVIKATMKFLADKGYIPDDSYEFKDMLRRIWFSQFQRVESGAGSSGFETVFLVEKFDSEIIGLHNWIYYAKMEAKGKLNYLGYIKEASLGTNGAVLKVRSSLNGIVQPITSIFVGTSPELEMALYTMCFFTRPNHPCPIKLAGKDIIIIANRVNYFGKEILVSAFPDL